MYPTMLSFKGISLEFAHSRLLSSPLQHKSEGQLSQQVGRITPEPYIVVLASLCGTGRLL